MVSALEEQAFIVGDVMRNIDELYSERYYSNIDDDNKNKKTQIYLNLHR
jgi:hypothetical protein